MAAEIGKIIDSLLEFYKFKDRVIISVGAGGGQLIEYGRDSKKVFAVDNDEEALHRLKENLLKKKLNEKFTLVIFEFCLHEMKDPEAAIKHARIMAPDIIIADHWPDSEWAYIGDEKEKVERSWSAVKKIQMKKVQKLDAVQHFNDYEELYEKVKVQGEVSINRISCYKEIKDIKIPMPFGFCLI
jgi:hypothetical protein